MDHREEKPEARPELKPQAQILVIGLGNPILGDDGIGWHIARKAETLWRARGHRSQVDFLCLSTGGLSLMERLEGYEQAIIADSIITGNQPSGSLYSFPLEDLPDLSGGHLNSAHDASLRAALSVGQKMGFSLPRSIWVVAVEIQASLEFAEEPSPGLMGALRRAAALVVEQLKAWD